MTNGLYIAFDQSLANTGWSVGRVEGDRLDILNFGVYKTSNSKTEQERLASIEDHVRDLLLRYSPQKCYTEDVFLMKGRPYQGKVLIKVQTTINNLLYNNAVDYDVIDAKTWRKELNISKKVGGKSESTRRIRVGGLTEHSADSVAILLVGLFTDGIVSRDTINEYVEPEH